MWHLIVHPVEHITGEVTVPGDKSISHRAVLFGALTNGKVEIDNFLLGEDCLHTVDFVRELGVPVQVESHERKVVVTGVGLEGLKEPSQILEVGNAGTLIRIGLGLLAACPFYTVITGDESICQRPMGRIVKPLTLMGAEIRGRIGNTLAPIAVSGGRLHGIHYHSNIASAQVKSAILLAGLLADEGETIVEEPAQSRDHTERMLRYFGADIRFNGYKVGVKPEKVLQARPVYVPGDISSAAFLFIAALLKAESEVIIRNVGYNPSRSGIVQVLQQMGGAIEIVNLREWNGEPLADFIIKASFLHGIHLGGSIIPNIIDEIPAIALLATQAHGRTTITDAAELRVKESDRIATIVHGLRRLGAKIEERPDGMVIDGPTRLQGGVIDSFGDHRIAMSMAIAGLIAKDAVRVNDTACIRTSFPDFVEVIEKIAGKGVILENEV